MNEFGLVGLFCGISVTVNSLIALYFFFNKSNKDVRYLLLGLIFMSIAIKLSKTVWFFIFFKTGTLGLVLSFSSLMFIGPLSFLFFTKSENNVASFGRSDLLHLIVPLVGTLTIAERNESQVFYAYWVGISLFAIYTAIIWSIVIRQFNDSTNRTRWSRSLVIALSVILISMIFQHAFHGMMNYAIGAMVSSIPVYFLLIRLIKEPISFNKKKAEHLSEEIVMTVKEALEVEKLYLNTNCTLAHFSQYTQLPTYLISKIIHNQYGMTFPEAINYFRIEFVKEKMILLNDDFFKIEVLANDAGFKTPSAFYRAFNKVTGLSPKAYQHKILKKNA